VPGRAEYEALSGGYSLSRDIPASVHRRLLNHSRATGRPFTEVLQLYALDRFLFRLGQSNYRDQFILKGALMLTAWDVPFSRPTRDIDLLGRMENVPESVAQAVRALCSIHIAEDGLSFAADSVRAEQIMEGAQYSGVRVRFVGYLGKARVPMQIDVGFGDVLFPAAAEVQLPSVLALPPTVLLGYTRESVIAEKLQIMVALGEVNSRLKDYFDLWLLAQRYLFSGEQLRQAVNATFKRRNTSIALPIVALAESFADSARETQWMAFLRRNRLSKPESLSEAIGVVAPFALPVLTAIANDRQFEADWRPGGPWNLR